PLAWKARNRPGDGDVALSARLEIRQGQGLIITPQLQQAIKLLQMSNIEIEAFVEAELESNPLLQRDEREFEPPEAPVEAPPAQAAADRVADADARAELDASPDEASRGEHATGDAPDAAGDAGGGIDWSRAGRGAGGFDGEGEGLESAIARAKTLAE